MSKKVINIATIISGIDEEYQNSILRGIHDYALEKGFNVSNFVSFGGILSSNKHDTGEFNIFNLVNYQKFDGVILLTNTIPSTVAVEEIFAKVKKTDIPIVSIDYRLDDAYYIGIDNYKAMKQIVEHFVVHHGARYINYISGPPNNIDSILRFNAYKDVLEEHGIPFECERVYQGFFRDQDGRRAVNSFLESTLPMPEVIISANDTMIMSAMMELEAKGISVPDQIMVSGFDHIQSARNYYIEVTTVDRPLYDSGYLACEKIYNHINGIPQKRESILNTKPIFTASCGCVSGTAPDIYAIKRDTFDVIESYKRGIPVINRMAERLTESQSLAENIESLKYFIAGIHCEKFFLCLCEDWQWGSHSFNTYFSNEYRTRGYTDEVDVVIAYYDGKFGYYDNFKSDLMFPELFEDNGKGNIYYFSPIHYQDRCLGYTVICNSRFPIDTPIYHTWILNISNSLENIRKLSCLETVVKELEDLYVIDPLGNIYNRNGFSKFTRDAYADCVINKRQIMIMFIDMDGLKYINDHYGHKEGDNAITTICAILKKCCSRGEICARFGGDEFVVFASDYSEEDAQAFVQKFILGMNEYNSSSDKPYKIDASIGCHISCPEPNVSLFAMVSIADKRMYEEKKKKSHSKYLRRSE